MKELKLDVVRFESDDIMTASCDGKDHMYIANATDRVSLYVIDRIKGNSYLEALNGTWECDRIDHNKINYTTNGWYYWDNVNGIWVKDNNGHPNLTPGTIGSHLQGCNH